MKRENIIGNMWIPDRFTNEFTGPAPWINANHDTDRDGIPNWDDADPLNCRPNTFGMRKSR